MRGTTQKTNHPDYRDRLPAFLSCCLLRAAVNILREIWPVLLIVVVLVMLAVIIWRIIRHQKDLGKW